MSNVGGFCRKGRCRLLQSATSSTSMRGWRLRLERKSALVVRLAAIRKILFVREDLQKFETAPQRHSGGSEVASVTQKSYCAGLSGKP